MSLNIVDIPQSGGYFSPGENADAVAILIEVREFERQRPGSTYGPKDTIHADLTIFPDQASLDAGMPTEHKGKMIQQTLLVRDLERLVGNATIATLDKTEGKNGNQGAWVWRAVPGAVKAKVVEYANKREAALKEAQQSGEMPSFLS